MPRARRRIDYAPAGCGPKSALIGAVRQAFYACVPALPPGEDHNLLLLAFLVIAICPQCRVDVAFQLYGQQTAPLPDQRVIPWTRCRCEACRGIAEAVHHIVYGLAAPGPPAWFRQRNRLAPSGRGRPRAIEAEFVAFTCRIYYERITGERATSTPTGYYCYLVGEIFSALGIPDNPKRAARAAIDPARKRSRRRFTEP